MSTQYIILGFQPLPNASRCYISVWAPPMDLESCSLCICATPPLSWIIASLLETTLESWAIQKSTVLPSRHILAALELSIAIWFHGFCFSDLPSKFSLFRAPAMSCPRASSHKVFQVDRLTDSVDRDMITTTVKTNHRSNRALRQRPTPLNFLKLELCHRWIICGQEREGVEIVEVPTWLVVFAFLHNEPQPQIGGCKKGP